MENNLKTCQHYCFLDILNGWGEPSENIKKRCDYFKILRLNPDIEIYFFSCGYIKFLVHFMTKCPDEEVGKQKENILYSLMIIFTCLFNS